MVHLLLIGLFVVLLLHDADPVAHERIEAYGAVSIAGGLLGSMFGIWLATHLFVRRCGRMLDRTGQVQWAWTAERAVAASRVIAALLHAVGVLWFGWLVVVRDAVGDLVLLDELIAVAPALVVFIGGWASLYPIDRRMREAVMVRALDEGAPLPAYVSLPGHVMSFIRHQLGLILVPIVLVLGWAELVVVLGERWWEITMPVIAPQEVRQAIREEAMLRSAVLSGVQLVGALGIFACVPPIMRHVWRTRPLEPGQLRDDLMELCRAHRVRVRELLVWNTHGVMVNGAAMGLVGWMRYVLLSDGLLMGLSRDEVEAVAAHEVGHIRRRHIPWLAGAVVSGLMLTSIAADWAVYLLLGERVEQGVGLWIMGGAVLLIAGLVFGWVSRRFEWQADAFAAQHLSGWRGRKEDGQVEDVVVEPAGAGAMIGALGAVARLNHIPRNARSFRHGSIATRQNRLRDLIGTPAGRLPIDRQVARIKLAIGIGLLITVGYTVFATTAG